MSKTNPRLSCSTKRNWCMSMSTSKVLSLWVWRCNTFPNIHVLLNCLNQICHGGPKTFHLALNKFARNQISHKQVIEDDWDENMMFNGKNNATGTSMLFIQKHAHRQNSSWVYQHKNPTLKLYNVNTLIVWLHTNNLKESCISLQHPCRPSYAS